MKLAAFKVIPLSVPLKQPIVTSFGVMKARQACLLTLTTDEGLTGWGESWINYPSWGLKERVATLNALCEHIMGSEIDSVSAVTNRLFRDFGIVARQWGAVGPISQAISAIDLAVWDLVAQSQGLPVYQLLGGHTDRVRVYGSGIAPGHIEGRLRQAAEQGLEAVKVKIGFGQRQDMDNVRRVRDIWGDKPLMMDVNQAWDLKEAAAMFDKLEPYQPYWIEEPLPADRFDDLYALARYSSIPIAVGENIYGDTFVDVVNHDAIAFLQPDLTKAGGISKGLELAQWNGHRGLTVIPHVFGTALSVVAAAHFNAATHAPWLELDMNANPLREDLLETGYVIERGYVRLNNEPGWGITINQDVLAHYGTQDI